MLILDSIFAWIESLAFFFSFFFLHPIRPWILVFYECWQYCWQKAADFVIVHDSEEIFCGEKKLDCKKRKQWKINIFTRKEPMSVASACKSSKQLIAVYIGTRARHNQENASACENAVLPNCDRTRILPRDVGPSCFWCFPSNLYNPASRFILFFGVICTPDDDKLEPASAERKKLQNVPSLFISARITLGAWAFTRNAKSNLLIRLIRSDQFIVVHRIEPHKSKSHFHFWLLLGDNGKIHGPINNINVLHSAAKLNTFARPLNMANSTRLGSAQMGK